MSGRRHECPPYPFRATSVHDIRPASKAPVL